MDSMEKSTAQLINARVLNNTTQFSFIATGKIHFSFRSTPYSNIDVGQKKNKKNEKNHKKIQKKWQKITKKYKEKLKNSKKMTKNNKKLNRNKMKLQIRCSNDFATNKSRSHNPTLTQTRTLIGIVHALFLRWNLHSSARVTGDARAILFTTLVFISFACRKQKLIEILKMRKWLSNISTLTAASSNFHLAWFVISSVFIPLFETFQPISCHFRESIATNRNAFRLINFHAMNPFNHCVKSFAFNPIVCPFRTHPLHIVPFICVIHKNRRKKNTNNRVGHLWQIMKQTTFHVFYLAVGPSHSSPNYGN